MTTDAPSPRPRLTFRRRHRLSKSLDYQAVFRRGARRVRDQAVVFALPNALAESRLGLSVGRRVGGAVVRNTIKRRLREAFRLSRAELPAGYDVLVNVRPHAPARVEEYRAMLVSACRAMHDEWSRGGPRARRQRPAKPGRQESSDGA